MFGSMLFLLKSLKETSLEKSRFIHATKGGWEQVPVLEDRLIKF